MQAEIEPSNTRWLSKTCQLLADGAWPENVPLSFDGSWFDKGQQQTAFRRYLQHVRDWGKVQKLTLKNACLDKECKLHLEDALAANPSLTKLRLHAISSSDGNMEFLSRALFSSNKNIEELTIDKCEMQNEGGELLERTILGESLRVLKLLRMPLDDIVRRIATQLSHPSSLKSLDISGSTMSSKMLSLLLNSLVNNSTLESLVLRNCGIGEASAESINEFLKSNATLKHLDLSNNNIWGDTVGLWASGGLKTNTSLRKLQLSQNPIGDEGAQHLAKLVIQNPTLHTLSLIDCEIWGPGCQSLASGLAKMKGLRHLFVGGEMEDYAAIVLESLQSNMTLTHLWTDHSAYLIHKDRQWRLVEFFLRLNRGKRRLLVEHEGSMALWPRALASLSGDPRLLYYMLRQKPELVSVCHSMNTR